MNICFHKYSLSAAEQLFHHIFLRIALKFHRTIFPHDLKNLIPDKVRIPAFVVVIATFVTVVEMVMQAYVPVLFESLGIFIPLIVVNCIVLGRAEAFASKNNVLKSALDGLGMGLGFTFALTLLGVIRELLGTGKAFGFTLYNEQYGMLLFVLAPGAFIALGFLIAVMNKLQRK